MPTIVVETWMDAPAELCFDLARDIEIHVQTSSSTGERVVGGVTDGLLGPNESVTFEGVHLGVRQRFTARITEFNRPHYFLDEMTEGAFRSFTHLHQFLPLQGGTLMRDIISWRSPLGPLGWLADKLFLERHLTSLLVERTRQLKEIAERRTAGP